MTFRSNSMKLGTDAEFGQAEGTWSIFRRLAFTIYIPFIFAGLGRGMLLPTIPLYLRESGLGYGEVAIVLAMVGVGAIVSGIPTGWAAAKFGPHRLFVAATIMVSATAAIVGTTTLVWLLLAFRLAFGLGQTGLRVSLQTLVRGATQDRSRGRAMAMVGGMRRVSVFVGPLLGGVLADMIGYSLTFVISGAISAVGLVPFLLHWPTGDVAARPVSTPGAMRQVFKRHGSLLLLAGAGPALVMTVREGREVIVPLIGDSLELSASLVGLLVAIGTGTDLVLFPVAGWLSDRFGRMAAMIPAFALLGLGMVMLGLWPTTVGMVAAVIVMGVGNGLSAGTMLTLGADISPEEPGPFLAAFGMMSDTGLVIGPLLVGWFAGIAGLSTSAFVLGALMFVGLAVIVVAVGDTSRPTRPWLVSRLPT